jgi:lactoylglutathione lyase
MNQLLDAEMIGIRMCCNIPGMKKIRLALALMAGFLTVLLSGSQSGSAKKVAEFDHSTVYVRDLLKSAEFYERVLGLQRITEPFKDGRHVWFRIGPHDQLHVVSGATEAMPHDVNVHLAFRVASFDDFVSHLDQMGIKYRRSIRDESKGTSVRPDGVHQVYFQDPDGYWIEVNDDRF